MKTSHISSFLPGFGLVACLGLVLAGSDSRPLRVAIRPARVAIRGPKEGDIYGDALSMYLYERLVGSRLRVLPVSRTRQVLGELESGVRVAPETGLFADVRQSLPIDAFVDVRYNPEGTRLTARVLRADSQVEFETTADTARDAVRELLPQLADALGIAGDDRVRLLEDRLPNPASFAAYYAAQLANEPWPRNSAEARLKLLNAAYQSDRASLLLKSQIPSLTLWLVNSRNREQTYASAAWALCDVVVFELLGTEFEQDCIPLVQKDPDRFEERLLECAKSTQVAMDAPTDDEGEAPAGDIGLTVPKAAHASPQQALGALRLLGAIRPQKGQELLLKALQNDDVATRMAAADGLGEYDDEPSLEALQRAWQDEAPGVRVHVGHALWKRKAATEGLLPVARSCLRRKYSEKAAELVCELAEKADQRVLLELLSTGSDTIRPAAADALCRLGPADQKLLSDMLDDVSIGVVTAALRHLPTDISDALRRQTLRLANDFCTQISAAAQLALTAHRPDDPAEQAAFDLAVEHDYLRLRLLDRLASSSAPWAHRLLEGAVHNSNEYVRARVLRMLTERDPQRAAPVLLRAVSDPYHWVRLHAAALLAKVALPGQRSKLAALAAEALDPAVKAYLTDAVARAEGRPVKAPEPPPKPRTARTWLCGTGEDCESSPYEAYYLLSIDLGEGAIRAAKAGKTLFARANTVGNTFLVPVDRASRNQAWRAFRSQLTDANLPYLTGVVLGEESMNMTPDWGRGWRLFCVEAGIDPKRVAGKLENLTRAEKSAWAYWAHERCIEGFNFLYDFLALKYRRLNPRLQVCTFLPFQGSAGPAEIGLKCDVVGGYHYIGHNRTSGYDMIRRSKTMWPDRPVLWLSNGIGVYERNPVRKYQRVPRQPLETRRMRPYADSCTAYAAGAESGWFSVWIAVAPSWKGTMQQLSGVQFIVEDIIRGGNTFERAIAHAWQVDRKERQKLEAEEIKKELKKVKVETDGLEMPGDDAGEEDLEELFEPDKKEEERRLAAEKAKQELEEKKEAFRQGFLYYRDWLYDAARVFASLPPVNPKPPALVVWPGIGLWTVPRSKNPEIPGKALLCEYDFLNDLNKLPELGIDRYRLLVVHNPSALRDATIRAVTRWLVEKPGLLYVHLDLTADNSAEASRIGDLDGQLQEDWPWEKDLRVADCGSSKKLVELPLTRPDGSLLKVQSGHVGAQYEISNPAACKVLLRHKGRPCVALWRKPGMKGAVLFDGVEFASSDYLAALAEIMNDLHRQDGLGVPVGDAVLHQDHSAKHVTISSGSNYFRPLVPKTRVPGFAALTGEADPTVGAGEGAVIVRDFVGDYVAQLNGILILSDQRLRKVEAKGDGVLIEAPAVVRLTAAKPVAVRRASGKALPEAESLEVLRSGTDGWCRITTPGGVTHTHFRASGGVVAQQSKE